ncbi:hypothetical protein MHY01S_00140 [Meiothermus hypogaeus NBRC 106114]|uniref:Tail fiber protein n=2 Tax=Meiothermus hypogaeus TaxID=884155 RepID=A0A511QWU5_9DEIN|nr:hypothetical protein Mhypo_01200 [Meiothermus hypogaeus]GEM81848.1 hypothetical protein MHY01S_00140 [Meiothermus hypogaeus NBRC 106114]
MPKNLTPQDQWETDFQVPLPGEPRNIGPLELLFQRILNRSERLKSRVDNLETAQGGTTLSTHRTASTLDHPDGSVTAQKLAPIRNAPTITPAGGDWLLGGQQSGTGVGKILLGSSGGVPLLTAGSVLASPSLYSDRGTINVATDWNTLANAGGYQIQSAALGGGSNAAPPTTSPGLLVVHRAGARTQQIYYPETEPYIYYRMLAGGSWTAWAATGQQYISNANGAAYRFGDGTQICWLIEGLAGSSPQTWTFPATFIAKPIVSFISHDPGYIHTNDFTLWSTTQARVRKYQIGSGDEYTGSGLTLEAIAIGRWK